MANYFDIINAAVTGGPIVDSTQPSTQPGQIIVENSYTLWQLSVKIRSGVSISLKEVFTVLEIYEDIFSSSIHGFVEINDVDGGLEKFAFSGGETINLTVLKAEPSTDILISRDDLIVHEISKVDVNDQNSLRYRLHFVPLASVNSQKKRLFRSYNLTNYIPSLITKIYKEVNGESNLGLFTSSEAYTFKNFICPGYTPFYAINYLAKRMGKFDINNYHVFFERANKMNGKQHILGSFAGIKYYWDSINYIPNLFYNPQPNYVTETNNLNFRISSIDFQSNFNHMSNMMSGMYNTKITMLDPKSRKQYSSTSSYSNDAMFGTNNVFLKYGTNEYPGERLTVFPNGDPVDNKSAWMNIDVRAPLDKSLIRATADIEGGSNIIGAGNIIKLKIPSLQARALNINSEIMPDDMVYAGEYLVTAVRHIFTFNTYVKKIEMSKGNIPPPTYEGPGLFDGGVGGGSSGGF